jgi:HD-GYP domain-containing protein (c-di-GMP phosphodiesterase class II)
VPWRRSSLYGTLRALAAAVDLKAGYLPGHSDGVSYIVGMMAREAGYDPPTVNLLELAALLHDLGKLGVPDSILLAERKLTEAEFAVVREHPRYSAHLVATLDASREDFNLDAVLPWVLHHHERFDGAGYPAGLAADAIPWPARMIFVADAFHVITTDRPYQRSRTRRDALAILREQAGHQFCPHAVGLLEARGHWQPADPPLARPPHNLSGELPGEAQQLGSSETKPP